jgi:GNAT superfamily N-acetyltransferase
MTAALGLSGGTRYLDFSIRSCEQRDVAVFAATEPPGAHLAEWFFARQLAGEVTFLIAWLGGVPIGSCELVLGARPEVRNLNVRGGWRGHGVGSALISASEDRVREDRVREDRAHESRVPADRAHQSMAREGGILVVGVALDNPDARRLYERLGFQPTGILSTTTYEFVDPDGITRKATEVDEELIKHLAPSP